MATVVLKPDAQKFPAGTTVKAYKRSTQPAVWSYTGAPQGTQDASATVATDGSVTFTGLADSTEYLLYAATPDRYATFVTGQASGDSSEQVTFSPPSGSTTVTQVASSATVVTLQAANSGRRGLHVFNDSTAVLKVKFGSGASATSYTVQVPAGGYFELPAPFYRGIVTGIWASANGNAYVTEVV